MKDIKYLQENYGKLWDADATNNAQGEKNYTHEVRKRKEAKRTKNTIHNPHEIQPDT